jgi:transposase
MSKNKRIVFKDYAPNQQFLLPPSLSDLIPATHAVRVVNDVIDRIDLDPLLKTYSGGGASSYHPKMMLKVLIYAYLNNVYSSRRIEAALKENVNFMWLSGMTFPDHNTINRFRSNRLKHVVKDVFTEVVLLLMESGHLDLKQVYTDGTKIEADANKYTFIWGKSIQTSRKRIQTQLEELWKYAEQLAGKELDGDNPAGMGKLDAEKVEGAIAAINKALEGKAVDQKKRQKLNYAGKNWPDKLKQYEEQEAIMGGRSSCSKTDPDATFMRLKEDHMMNGQLKPAYNLQLSTNGQYIVNYSLHQTTTDTTTLIEHLEQIRKQYGRLPSEAVADAGYGSEQNYSYLESQGVEAFVKYNYFHIEQTKQYLQKNPFRSDRLFYNPERNELICPMGQPMIHIGDKNATTSTGYKTQVSVYQSLNCKGCPLRGACHKGAGNRVVEINHNLNRLKAKARENLNSEKGQAHRSQRPADVEAVFGQLKHNKNFKRFMLRGLDKVAIETGLLAVAMNLKKLATTSTKHHILSALNAFNLRCISILSAVDLRGISFNAQITWH